MQVLSINYILRLRHSQKHKNCFCWFVCSTDIFKKVNLALLAYQNIVGVGFVNCTTYLWHVPKLTQYLCLRVFRIAIYGLCDSNWLVFFSFYCLVCKLWVLFQTFQDMWTVLKYYRVLRTVLYSKINFNWEPLFSHILLLNKLNQLNFFKLQNIFEACPAT